VNDVGASPPAKDPPSGPADGNAQEPEGVAKLKTIGGLVAVLAGAVIVGAIAIVAISVDSGDAATIASSAAGVIATIVGAFFGLKIGSDQTKTASENQKVEAAKAQVFAAHLPPDEAKDILGLANEAAKKVLGK
jgi:hypothetical protein